MTSLSVQLRTAGIISHLAREEKRGILGAVMTSIAQGYFAFRDNFAAYDEGKRRDERRTDD